LHSNELYDARHPRVLQGGDRLRHRVGELSVGFSRRHPLRLVRAIESGDVRRVKIEGLLDQSVEGVESLSAPGECIVLDNTAHPVTPRLNLATALRNVIGAFGIEWDGPPGRTNGHFAPFDWRGETA
jgi:hypothetical protein